MSQEEESRKEVLGARSSAGDAGGFAPSSYDPGTEPTISSVRILSGQTQPTRLDPNAPIHQGAVAAEHSRPTARNHVALPAGYTLQEYTIEAVLGSGGFGITYRARDNNLQCLVAIKEYLPNDLAVRTGGQTVCAKTESDTHGYRVGLDGFLAEARVLATFRHPHIVRVNRFFEANNTAYMVMDYERGEPLRDWIKQHGPLEEKPLLQLFLPLLEGLDVVHKARVLHRDIKPANIYVREDEGGLVLLDFGAARYARSGDSRSLTSIVTPGYAPFEQYHTHGAQGPWSDLYAFGGVLYWMISGEKPLEAPSRVRSDAMPSAQSVGKGRYSERLLRAVDWALNPDETERPKSVSQFKAVLTGESEVPRPPPKTVAAPSADAPKRPSSRAPLLFGLIGAAIAAVAAVALYPKAPKSEPAAVSQEQPAVPAAMPATEALKTEVPKPAEAKKLSRAGKGAGKPAVAEKAATPTVAVAEKPEEKKPVPAVPMATVLLKIVPQGAIVLDGKKLGNSPPLTRLQVTAGTPHKLEIHGTGISLPHYWTLELKPDETREISASFER